MHKVITFGEILMRLSPPDNRKFSQAKNFEVIYGGGEFNVAASLSNYGIDTEFVTALPDIAIGDCALSATHEFQVGSKHIIRQGERLGIYFIETGNSIRPSKVVYDRRGSAISQIEKGVFNWEQILEGANWFHWSGVTPALSQATAEVCLEAIKMADKMGLGISTDLNYRSKLWQYGKAPHEVMPEMLQYSNVILGDIDTAMFMLGKDKVAPNYSNDEEIKTHFSELTDLLPKLNTIGMTFRDSVNASHQRIGGFLFKDDILYRAKNYEVQPVVDRVGTGDAFMGGFLYGLLEFGGDMKKTIDFATSACALKHSIFGDVNRVTKEEVLECMASDGSAKVNR
ncbi:sugar kinase [Christiangramia forsetii]|uniref:2-dehydro-3-deoxygluconokinase n=2 Tax=Christiangramia forsetii TaxID=411153 RepID=A0M233_CHRFK|nr:sugar kinase [Christiangramia forsetii]GGG40227.1 2-dehydro-3-deoxygluconokinase [Christiangramia forsetii]CAL66678.1 2-dehydro-3-deoxygluconokinase [Christiangramia forsetii KT0803]